MLPSNPKVVSADQFIAQLDTEVIIAEFSSKEEEVAYEKLDAFLTHLIKKRLEEQTGYSEDETWHVNEDWWPNHSRFVEINTKQCTLPLLTILHELLTEEFMVWRIIVWWVYDDMFNGATNSRVGCRVYADCVAIGTGAEGNLPGSW